MATQVIMPQMGESVAEGTITRWLKAVGDEVVLDEPIFEITTDKVDAEIPAPVAGVLLEIRVQSGETVDVGAVVAVIGAAGESAGASSAEEAPEDAGESGDAPAAAAEDPPATEDAPAADKPRAEMSAAELRRTRSTPVVRKIAAEHGIEDLSAISGSGLDGRVTRKDIEAFVAAGGAEQPATEQAATGKPAPAKSASPAPAAKSASRSADSYPSPAAPAAPAGTTAGRVELFVPKVAVKLAEGDTWEPMTPMRRTISDRMSESKQYSAHVHTCFEVDYTRVDALRRRHKDRYAAQGGRLTFTTFLAKAAIDALRAFPVVNAAHDGENVIYRRAINLGIAVALDRGLLVPAVREADELSMLGLSKRIADLGERARNKRLMPDEVAGITFSITNPGIFGSQWGTPIIPQPTVAILGVGTIEKRVKVHTLADGSDTLVIRTCGYLTLGFDHRLIDGAVADQFMSHLKNTLESFDETAL